MRRIQIWWLSMVVALPPCLARAAEPAAEAAWHIASIGPTTRNYVQHILSTGDHEGLPFAIVDKVASTIQVYRADGSLVGTSSVLLGQTRGDTIVPGTGERTQTRQLRPMDRTTPAGRFYSEPGHNQVGEAVVWIDYAAALAIHRLRPGLPQEKRAQRMASGNPLDKRISAGCVVVPVAFYLDVVQPTLGHNKGIVYVMTENGDQPR